MRYGLTTINSMKQPIDHLKIVPLTPKHWPKFEDLIGQQGPCSRCWCMYWRIGPAYHQQSPEENKIAFHGVVSNGPPPGLLALEGEVAIGWCQLTPRDVLAWLDHVKQLRRVDDLPVWCISCFYIRKGYRRRGITTALIDAAISTAGKSGAAALEAYPLDAEMTSSTSFTGYASTFLRAGFKVVARHVPSRPMMRIDLLSPDLSRNRHSVSRHPKRA